MRFRVLTSLAFLVVCHIAAHGEDRKFPYQAIVETDGEYVRSGPGPSFYPTEKLRKGDKVTVHRHDPGGWCMIVPPPGSFSWIRAEHVQRSGESSGILKANQVVVHVGSALSIDEFTTIQGNLSKGEAVTILGEKSFPFDDGPKLMYKIKPVRREWRWIQRKAIVPADAIRSEPFPGETPPKRTGPVASTDTDPFAQPISTGDTVTGSGDSKTAKTRPAINPDASGFQDQLDAIDTQFRDMRTQEPATWDLASIKRQYLELDNDATQPSQSRTVALRLDAVTRYEKMQRDYMSFLKASDETRQRDADLAQQQREAEQRALGLPVDSAGSQPQPRPQPQPTPDPAGPGPGPATTTPVPGAPGAPAFAGAGMVVPMSQTFPGGPQYALVAPGGKLLAYLVPGQGVNLKGAVNQSMGIIGERSFRKEWGADVINVRGLQPVQLRAGR